MESRLDKVVKMPKMAAKRSRFTVQISTRLEPNPVKLSVSITFSDGLYWDVNNNTTRYIPRRLESWRRHALQALRWARMFKSSTATSWRIANARYLPVMSRTWGSRTPLVMPSGYPVTSPLSQKFQNLDLSMHYTNQLTLSFNQLLCYALYNASNQTARFVTVKNSSL